MKKLLQINTVASSASTGRIAEEIGQVAIANGWDSYFAYGRNERPSHSQLIKIGSDWSIKRHVLYTRLFDRHAFGSSKATRKLVEQIEKLNPDIIHLHNLHGYYINIKILFQYLQKKNIPVVWTLYDCWAFTGHCTYFDTVGCEKWKTKCFKCPSINEYPSSWMVDNSELNFNIKKELFTSLPNLTLIVHSEWLKKLIKQSFLKDIPVKMIHNGVNISNFLCSKNRDFVLKNKLGNFKIILGVAYVWDKRKGINDFILLSHLIDPDTRILLVGVPRDQLKNLPDNIITIAKTENVKELAEIYSSVNVFVNPTWEDNFPTTNLEALACGTPVITYNTGGSPESVDSKTGIIIEKGDIRGLIHAVKEVLEKGKEFYSIACVERAQQLFNKEDQYKEYLKIFNSLLEINHKSKEIIQN